MDYLQYWNLEVNLQKVFGWVLNLVINGLPSIHVLNGNGVNSDDSFKPCYKWITFNTDTVHNRMSYTCRFKPCYKWITFNTKTQERYQEYMKLF